MKFIRDRLNLGALWLLLFGLAILLSLLIVSPAYAAVVGEWQVNLLRGSTTQQPASKGATQEAAWADCQQRIAAQPPSSSTWTCQTPRYVARVIADPSVCTAPQPPAETQPGQCPVGTAGNWDQSRSYITAPYPTCWTAGPWVPAEPPVGACVEPPPPPTGDWVRCAVQEQRCSFTGTRLVRYGCYPSPSAPQCGVNGTWTSREFTDGVTCNGAAFGSNPAPGALKECQLQGSEPEPPPPPPPVGTGTATLNWRPPTHNVDDTPANLTGYMIRYGRSADFLSESVAVPVVTTHTVTGLGSGTWYFGVAALSNGGQSVLSNIGTKAIP